MNMRTQTEELAEVIRCEEIMQGKASGLLRHMLRLSERLDMTADDIECVNDSPVAVQIYGNGPEMLAGIGQKEVPATAKG